MSPVILTLLGRGGEGGEGAHPMLMRDAEGRKKEAKVKQSKATQHTQYSHFSIEK